MQIRNDQETSSHPQIGHKSIVRTAHTHTSQNEVDNRQLVNHKHREKQLSECSRNEREREREKPVWR